MGEVRRDDGKRNMFWRSARSWPAPTPVHNARRRLTLAKSARPSQIWAGRGSYPANGGLFDACGCFLGRVESASETQPFFFGHNEQSLKFAALAGPERRLG